MQPTFSELVIFWMEISTTRQISNQKIYFVWNTEFNFSIASKFEARFLHGIRFRRKNCFWNFKVVVKSRSQKSFIWSIFTVKTSKLAFFVHFCKSCSGKKIFVLIKNFWIKSFFKKSVLNHFLYSASYSESRNSNESDLEPFFTPRQLSSRKI